MRAQAQAAIAIDPEFADAYDLLARAQSMEGDNPAALAAFDKAIILNPQNEIYRMNLANYYLAVHDWDSAKKILSSVAEGSNPSLANAARAQLENIDRIRENEKTNPGGFVATRQPFEESKEPDDAPPPPAHPVPVHYVKGKLLRVDCTAEPGAKLTVDIAAKSWTFSVADRAHMVLLGADTFSCDWHDRKVAINYREHGDNQGDIVSLEIQ
jgi:tetratricopeptide (TPR) repeat protein